MLLDCGEICRQKGNLSVWLSIRATPEQYH
jgi:hypothetical protein